jgi:lipopolysaccharide/colanic/teichoic acid biosynthesis glycosyltransferase
MALANWLNSPRFVPTMRSKHSINDLIAQITGNSACQYLEKFADLESPETLVIHSTNIFNVLIHPNRYKSIVNLGKVNDIRFINKFFESVNSRLTNGDQFIVRFETFTARRKRKTINRIPIIGQIYFLFEFVFMRVFPKVPGLKKLYFFITRGHNRLLSKAEVLGRLVSCGFSIENFASHDGYMFVVTRKFKEPAFNMNPSYGLLYKMPRVSKNGKMIGVYKFRTMHPYAEYLQDYVVTLNGYSESGKPANDFRLTPWGKFLRRYWLDELPQIINLLKGELKLVGVRPISKRFFEDIPEDLRTLRSTQKPGCIPPYVALNRKSDVTAVLEAEREYIHARIRDPYTTDIRFFFAALFNIFVMQRRSA